EASGNRSRALLSADPWSSAISSDLLSLTASRSCAVMAPLGAVNLRQPPSYRSFTPLLQSSLSIEDASCLPLSAPGAENAGLESEQPLPFRGSMHPSASILRTPLILGISGSYDAFHIG